MTDETHCKSLEPTREQRLLLSRIVNSQQRLVLTRAIEMGEDIPSYAWEPIPEELDATTVYSAVKSRMAQQKRTDTQTQTASQQVRPPLIATIEGILK